MIETLSGISAGWLTELITMNSPRRSIFASTEIFIGGSIGTSPSPCHSPISGWKSFIVGLLFRGSRSKIRPGRRSELTGPERRGRRHSLGPSVKRPCVRCAQILASVFVANSVAEFNCRLICKQRVAGSNPAVGSNMGKIGPDPASTDGPRHRPATISCTIADTRSHGVRLSRSGHRLPHLLANGMSFSFGYWNSINPQVIWAQVDNTMLRSEEHTS